MAEETHSTTTETAATETAAQTESTATATTEQAHAQTAETQESGALSAGAGEEKKDEGEAGALAVGEKKAEEALDYEKMTDDEYIGKVKLPEGQKWDNEVIGKYAALLRESKIPPEVFSKFVALDAKLSKEANDAAQKKYEDETKAAREAFAKAKEDFTKEYTPEQTKQMNDTLSKLDDKTFVTLVTKSPLANSKTMGKMILAYRQVYGEDSVPSGTAQGGERGFAEVWTGKKI